MNESSSRPSSETIVPRLLDAVEELCARGNPESVGMRDIAAEAGLSVGVAYRYFESKTDLLGATMVRIAERLASAVTSTDEMAGAMEAFWTSFSDNPAFVNIGSWMVLQGYNVTEVMSAHPGARELVRSATAKGFKDPPTYAGVVLMTGLAGAFYGVAVNRALGRDDDDPRVFDAAAEALAVWAQTLEAESDG